MPDEAEEANVDSRGEGQASDQQKTARSVQLPQLLPTKWQSGPEGEVTILPSRLVQE